MEEAKNGTHLTVDEVAALSGIDNPDVVFPEQDIIWNKTMVQKVAFMKRIHPRLAAAIFAYIYFFIGFLIDLIFHKNLFGNIIYIILGATIGLIIHIIFEKKYYGDIIEEKKEEAEFSKKAFENRKKLEEKE